MKKVLYSPTDTDARERWLAHWVGSAAGHLFALAELNYDLTYGKTTQPSETTESTMLEESKTP